MGTERKTPASKAAEAPQPQHFATLQERFNEGKIGRGTDVRRVIPHLSEHSAFSWKEMAAWGNRGGHAATFQSRRLPKS